MLSLHYNGSNSFLFVNAIKIYQFKAKDSEINPYPLGLGYISKVFTIDNTKKTGLKGSVQAFSVDVQVFSVDQNAIDNSDILDIHRYFMKET